MGLLVGLVISASAQAGQWDRNAVYAAREAELKQALAARPNDPEALVDLAAFYLKPLAPGRIEQSCGSFTLAPDAV